MSDWQKSVRCSWLVCDFLSGAYLPFVEAPRKNSRVVSRSTVPQTVGLGGRYRDAGVQLFLGSIYKNDTETPELLATEVMPHFA
jgi:hypothetical protein